ncbi:hypothetical protein MKX01_041046 [Papaver californicum]|nr:hypothetical protein MKX01_041046 [Papaver californicum]
MACHGIPDLKPEWLGASVKTAEKMNLLTFQNKMKIDPQGYETELTLLNKHFDSLPLLFQQQSALSFSSINGNPTVSKDLGDMAMFLAHVAPYYPTQLSDYPCKLADLLRSSAKSLPLLLRCHLTKALILLTNRKVMNTWVIYGASILGDRTLRKDAFSHVIHSIRQMNQKHKNETQNKTLQNILFAMLQEEDETKAKRALIVLCDLHRRRVWFDETTANAICTACFHPSSRIMNAALSFLLGFEKIDEADDTDVGSSEDGKNPQVVLQREDVYKLQRAIRSMKRQQCANLEKDTPTYYSPLNHLFDAQGFAEKLFSRLQTCNERCEVKMMILKVIARTVGLHRLILLNFYPFLQKYVQPHQCDITELLASAVQACHDMVPSDAVEPLFRQVVNQFVHDKARTEVCPSLLVKKDQGRPTNPKARPKAFEEVNVASNVSVLELLQNDSGEDEENDGSDSDSSRFDNDEGEATLTTGAHTQLSEEANDETEGSGVGFDDDNESDQSEEEEFDGEDEDVCEDEEMENFNKYKRKLSDNAGELNADTSLRALKRIPESTRVFESSDLIDRWAKLALGQHGLLRKGPEAKLPGFKIPSSEELRLKRVNPSVLEANIRRKMAKEERPEVSCIFILPKVAKRAKIVRSQQEREIKPNCWQIVQGEKHGISPGLIL